MSVSLKTILGMVADFRVVVLCAHVCVGRVCD